MTIAAVVAILVAVGVIVALATTRVAPDAILMSALVALMVVPVPNATGDGGWQLGVLTVPAALAGFANEGLATVGALLLVVAGLRETGVVEWITQSVLGRPRSVRGALVRLVLPVAGVSGLLNNTPVVAMMIPAVEDWAKRLRLPPSKLMIPLSYAAILGGTCTLIGTSTNLVVAGLVVANTAHPPIGVFEVTWIGVPAAIAGAAFLILLGPKLLPDRQSAAASFSDPRQYTLDMVVPASSPLVGKSIEEAGLRQLPGCYLVEIDRRGDLLPAIGPEQRLHAGDRLVFAGIVDAIRDLQKLRGLEVATEQVFKLHGPRHRRRLFEAVVGPACPLVRRTVREGRFRSVYGAAVIAVARDGERVQGRIGDIELRPGDTLLLEAELGWADRQRNQRDFLLVSRLEDSAPRRHEKAPIALAVLIAMVAVAAVGWLTMLEAALLAAAVMIVTRCCSLSAARQNVDWSLLVVIGAALGLGAALQETGAATAIAGGVLSVVGDRPWLALLAIYLVTSLLTEIITNNAAVAIAFPIAYATSSRLGVDFTPFIFTIMMAGSASFASPLGYQTNLMVYGPGGYRMGDFLRIGGLMNLLMAAVTVSLVPLIWSF